MPWRRHKTLVKLANQKIGYRLSILSFVSYIAHSLFATVVQYERV